MTLTPAWPDVAYPDETWPDELGTVFDQYPVLGLPTPPPLTSHRTTNGFTYELLDQYGQLVGPLEGVQPGVGWLEWSAARSVKGSGQITIGDRGQVVDWRHSRIRISRTITDASGVYIDPLGVWVPAFPDDAWTGTGRTWDVALLDVSTLLDIRGVAAPFVMPKGEQVTGWVENLVADIGLPYSLTQSALTSAADYSQAAGTSYLKIVGDLLDTINYFAAYADLTGVLHIDPYTPPRSRPIVWEFVAGKNCIHSPEWTRSQDWSSVPDQVILTTSGDGTTPGLVSTYTATTPILRTYSEQVEAADQPTLDALAERRWHDKASPQASVKIRHMPVPLEVNQAVRFASPRAGIDGRFVVSNTRVPLSATDLQETTLTEVL